MLIRTNRRGHNLIIKLKGELDHHSAEEFRKIFAVEWGKDGAQNLIVDFKEVTFMDSSGVGALIGRYKQVDRRGGKVAICNPSRMVARLIEMSGLLRIISVYRDEQEALKKI